MADRTANRGSVRLIEFARSVAWLGIVAVGVPWLLMLAARERFGGSAPLHGVPAPTTWSFDRVRAALSERLTDQMVADIVIRVSLLVAWAAVVVLVITVVFEVVHMVRHDGLAMPDVRGFGVSQRAARVIASGLLTLLPLLTSSGTAVARPASALVSQRATAGQMITSSHSPALTDPATAPMEASLPSESPQGYVVRSGDSIFGIAERLAGPSPASVAAYAERLIDLNLGREMTDGRRFTNAAFIDVGWVLQLPDGSSVGAPQSLVTDEPAEPGSADVHLVERGESLWSIAADELGDPTRWPEVFDANDGRVFDDGRTLTNPDLVQPGWDLHLPGGNEATSPDEVDEPVDVPEPVDARPAPAQPAVTEQSDVETVALADTDAGVAESAQSAQSAPATASLATPVVDEGEPTTSDNVWDERPIVAAADGSVDDADVSSSSLLALGGAAMLSSGVLTLLAVRRRNQLRRLRSRSRLPEPTQRMAETERVLRSIDGGERFVRVDLAVRAAALPLADQGGRVVAVSVGPDGALELRTSSEVRLPLPWQGDGSTWQLDAATPLEILVEAARGVPSPCPTLVQLGRDDLGRDVYVDLEALGAIEVGGPGADADSIVAGIAATLSGSPMAEVTTLVAFGVPDDAFLGHRRFVPAETCRGALDAAAESIGSTALMMASTFELRLRGAADETWEPAVVLIGAAAGTVELPARRNGLAIVSASPIQGPSSRLAPDDGAWVLQPEGIRLTPVGLTSVEVNAIAELVTVIDPEPEERPALDRSALDDGYTIAPEPDDDPPTTDEALDGDLLAVDVPEPTPSQAPIPDHALIVRLLGPVAVVDADGEAVGFERSKTRELVAWLATHRARSTRSAARTALWELDVRDATFANVVSEARRSLARLVEPPEGEEWVGRTMTDDLPLHELVRTDADLIRDALDAARVQPPSQAIATLAPAVEWIAGMPFAGTSYLWPDSEGITSNLVLLATTATTELAAHCLSVGDIEGVFDATARGLQVLAGHEGLIALRMEAHARAGDHAGVRLEWESYERVINADPWCDGEPAPKLVELRRQLLNPSR